MKIFKNLLSKFKRQGKFGLDFLSEDLLIIVVNEFINNLGGKNNIKNIYSYITRLRISVNRAMISI